MDYYCIGWVYITLDGAAFWPTHYGELPEYYMAKAKARASKNVGCDFCAAIFCVTLSSIPVRSTK